MFDSLIDLIHGAWWAYPLILGVSAGDVVAPILPSETVVITAGVIAGRGGLYIVPVIVMAAIGAFIGDNVAYWIGRRASNVATRLLARGERGKRSLAWAERTLEHHGGTFVVVGRYIPGGRTAVTLAAGITRYPYRRFAAADAIGASTWGAYSALIGYAGGHVFEQHATLALVVALGVSLVLAGLVELGRWLWRRRAAAREQQAAPLPERSHQRQGSE